MSDQDFPSSGAQLRRRREYPVKVINLDRDTERLARMLEWYSAIGIDIQRVPAILGSTVQGSLRLFSIRLDRLAHDGTLGCALSHVSAWMEVRDGDAPYALILEDDAKPLGELPSSIDDLGCPANFDVLYVNFRMIPRPLWNARGAARTLPLAEALATRQDGQAGYGGDGYFLSRSGAAKLVRAIYSDRIQGHVDLQLLAYGLSPRALTRLGDSLSIYNTVARVRARLSSGVVIRSYVAIPALVRAADGGVSSRTGGAKRYSNERNAALRTRLETDTE